MEGGAWLARVLAALYVLLAALAGLQIARIVLHRHRLFSFQGAFLILCFWWVLIRVVFWLAVDLDHWPVWLSHLLYVLPTVFQCATFSLLVLYYARLADVRGWSENKENYRLAFALAVMTMLSLTILFAGIDDRTSSSSSSTAVVSRRSVEKVYLYTSSAYFGVLVVLAAVNVARLARLQQGPVMRDKRAVLVTSMVFVVFLLRCVVDLLTACGLISTMHVYTVSSEKELSPLAFVLFLAWEVLPTSTIILYFWHIPRAQRRSAAAARCAASCPTLARWLCPPVRSLALSPVVGEASERRGTPPFSPVQAYRMLDDGRASPPHVVVLHDGDDASTAHTAAYSDRDDLYVDPDAL